MDDPPDVTAASGTGLARRTFLGGAGAAALGAAGVGGVGMFTGSALTPAAAAPPVPEADRDPLDLLRRMLAHDTRNAGQGANTRPHAEMLRAVWENADVPTEIIDTPHPDNVHLIARIPGTGSAAPLLMLGHSDVVPVERGKWSVDPFAGTVRDGQIYGRGALDMKGANSATVSALLRHLAEGARFERDIIVLTDCDEEAGPYGSEWLAKHHWDKVNAGSVLTEGGWFLARRDGTTPMLITATRQDKLYFNLDLSAHGTATHSSKPSPDAALVTLSRAVAELGDWLAPVHLTAVTREYFGALAKATDDQEFARALGLLLSARGQDARERAARVVVKRSSYPWLHQALLRTTHAFVIGESGYKENVIPSSAKVRVNCRGIPGGQRPRDFLAQVRGMADRRGVRVALAAPEGRTEEQHLDELDEAWAAPPADIATPLFRALSGAAGETYPDAVFAPALFEAGTSLAPWRERGIPGYGVYPYVIDNDQLVAMHGNDERIHVEALRRGTAYLYRMFARFLD
ncbi:M20/M25/M40 family metallo-hydrolase [Streptomyces sp. HNM0574]|uniref:M20/M25/M40 family metallo-hydrolase n=1 Tax=Streptomyces sp. HNM0574 TaxID=2714954 RepID=UPI00146F7269|nr:M20/M25/M40 family metallo-hydrolase [Streptomyces sp. HNM0574]NLU69841.1 M20/M25/M40 family metallo-hydrolase [Streptomyces sp. HNM0574]